MRGIDDRPQARPKIRFAPHAARSYTPVEVGQAYSFPAQATGDGETVGIIELGGRFDTDDLDAYFQGLGLTPPTVTAVSVDGGTNSPGTDTNADAGFIDAVSTAVNDTTHRRSSRSAGADPRTAGRRRPGSRWSRSSPTPAGSV